MNPSPPELIRALSQPLDPIPTGVTPTLPSLPGIRGVVFDIYGTLIVSGSGDIGVSDADEKQVALTSILRDLDIRPPEAPGSTTERLVERIADDHARSREKGIEFPEVEIRDIWQEVLGIDRGADLDTVAVAYECATNPVWPMPGCREVLEELRCRELALGIVSNAQFYTPLLFEAFFLQDLGQLGFDPDFSFFSYRHKQAKPGTWLYEQLAEALASRDLDPFDILYVGNDALKDIHPAAQLGFRTALFAGDERSYRPRRALPDLHPPDAIVTDLSQIPALLSK